MNPRRRFLQVRLVEMADSIRVKGVLQPLRARPLSDGSGLELVWGERRWRGATMVYQGYTDAEGVRHEPRPELVIPVMVSPATDAEVFELMMLENLEREDLCPSEEAAGYRRMMEVYGLSQAAVAERLGVSPKRISRLLPLLDLPNGVLERIDDGDLPVYVAQEALRVPAEWNGGEARMEALKLAEEAGSPGRAHDLIESRWLRPAREAAAWESEGCLAELVERWGEGIERVGYRLCREIFPPGITTLTPVTAGDFAGAEEVPTVPVTHYETGLTWRELAEAYGAPLYAACDGSMTRRLLVRRDLVADGARTRHTQEVTVADCSAGRAFSIEGTHVSVGDRVALLKFSLSAELPQGYVAGRIYWVVWTEATEEGQVFLLGDGQGSEALPLHGAGSGRMALLDVGRCPFLPLEGRTAVEAVRQESELAAAEADAAARARRAQMVDLLGRAEMAVRGEGGGRKAARRSEMFAKAVLFLAVSGAVGLSHNDHPGNRLMELLEKPEAEGVFDGWEGSSDWSLAGAESFAVCCWLLYFLDLYEGEDLAGCEQWLEVERVYGV